MRLLFYVNFLIGGFAQDDRFKIFPIEDLTDEGVASWNDIFSFCRNRGMTMATIVGQGQQDNLTNLLLTQNETSFPLGLYRDQIRETWGWRYIDKNGQTQFCATSDFSINNYWEGDAPDAIGINSQDVCGSVSINQNKPTWFSHRCDTKTENGIICVDRFNVPDRCIPPRNIEAYIAPSSDRVSWDLGWEYCKNQGKTMATIVGSGQQDDVISFLDIHMKENGKQSFNYYIGLTRDPDSDKKEWGWRFIDTKGRTRFCELAKFSITKFWGEANPPVFNEDVAKDCVAIEIGVRPTDANWLGQRCDLNTGSDGYVCVDRFDPPERCLESSASLLFCKVPYIIVYFILLLR